MMIRQITLLLVNKMNFHSIASYIPCKPLDFPQTIDEVLANDQIPKPSVSLPHPNLSSNHEHPLQFAIHWSKLHNHHWQSLHLTLHTLANFHHKLDKYIENGKFLSSFLFFRLKEFEQNGHDKCDRFLHQFQFFWLL